MRIVVLSNPSSGRGLGGATADACARALGGEGHDVEALTIHEQEDLVEALEDAKLLVICGGDGTLHHALNLLLRARASGASSGAAVYHAPTGTENLFAREFAMTRDAGAIVRAVAKWSVHEIDLGRVRGWPFAIMVSVGPDASVIHRVNTGRTGAITHLSYARPILAEAMRPALAALRVEADGRTVVDGRRGMLVVANLRQYAMRIDPARGAIPDDGLLDLVFFPAGTTVRLVHWVLRARLGLHTTALARALGGVSLRAAHVRVASLDREAPVQIDGEPGGVIHPGAPGADHAIEIKAEPRALRVLAP